MGAERVVGRQTRAVFLIKQAGGCDRWDGVGIQKIRDQMRQIVRGFDHDMGRAQFADHRPHRPSAGGRMVADRGQIQAGVRLEQPVPHLMDQRLIPHGFAAGP